MHASHFASAPFITVAVAFDRHTRPLIELGEALARRLGKSLCLVHAVEPWAELATSRPFGTHSVLWDTMQAVESSTRDRALARLHECAAWVRPGVEVEMRVLAGSPVSVIAREAADVDTCLLLVGTAGTGFRPLHGIATGASLLGSSPVPVLVINAARTIPDLSLSLKLLLADDLTAQSEGAVAFAAALAEGLGGAWIHHVHVNGVSAENLRVALGAAAAAAHTQLSERITSDVFLALSSELQCQLEGRFAQVRSRNDLRACKYTSEITSGGVRLELASVIEDMSPDLLVFGRHQSVHAKPFSLGCMPIRAMLELERPILVVPPV